MYRFNAYYILINGDFMKKVILAYLSFILLAFMSNSYAENNSYRLVNWNILKNMHKINEYVFKHKDLTTKQLIADPAFVKIATAVFTDDSYTAIFDKNTKAYIHKDPALVGKKFSDISNATVSIQIIKDAIKSNDCKHGFYTFWKDQKEKYMVVCPLSILTKDGEKLYYVYTMYAQSIPDFYLKTLKNAEKDQ